ncbi:DUF4254 domain-containing protein [Nocardia sp. NPDC049190]|uniref:DUF4254 domain-containing protein n=1 Tax=Nocardia sp. NPDC049190 TaxID=3155650 RepID=UPI0033C947DC
MGATNTSRHHALPDWHQICASFRDATGGNPGDHLITRWAHSLAQLHRGHYIDPGPAHENEQRRGDLIALINQWVTAYLRPATDSVRHVGRTVDALAAAYVDAELVLATAEKVSDPSVHDAWLEASALAVGWAELVAEVVDGQPPMS